MTKCHIKLSLVVRFQNTNLTNPCQSGNMCEILL